MPKSIEGNEMIEWQAGLNEKWNKPFNLISTQGWVYKQKQDSNKKMVRKEHHIE